MPELPAIDGLPNAQTHPAEQTQPSEFTGTVGLVRQEAREGGKEVPAAKFMEWLRTGIGQGRIPYNEKDARVHVVPEGVLLVTPNIFKDFTDECGGGRRDTVQKELRLEIDPDKSHSQQLAMRGRFARSPP